MLDVSFAARLLGPDAHFNPFRNKWKLPMFTVSLHMYFLGVAYVSFLHKVLAVDTVPALMELPGTTRALSQLGSKCQGRLSVFQVRQKG